MFNLENEYYVKFILLLFKGGSGVLQQLVLKGLEKQRTTLSKFLRENRATICNSKQISDFQRDLVYPPSGNETDITKWDISLLIFIILECLRKCLSESEILSVETLKTLRHTVFAQHTEAAIDARKFPQLWSELSLVITTISNSLKEGSNCIDLIRSIACSDLDANTVVQELSVLAKKDEVIETGLRALEGVLQSHQETADPSYSQDNSSKLLTEKMEQVNIDEAGVGSKDKDNTEEDEHDKRSTSSDTESIQSKDGQSQAEGLESQHTLNTERKKKRKKNKKNRKKDKESKRPKLQHSIVEEDENNLITSDTREETEQEMELKTLQDKSKNLDNAMDLIANKAEKQTMVFGACKKEAETGNFRMDGLSEKESTCTLFRYEGQKSDESAEAQRNDIENANKKDEESMDAVDTKNTKKKTSTTTETDTKRKLRSNHIESADKSKDDKDEYDVDTGFQTSRNETSENSNKGKPTVTTAESKGRNSSNGGQSKVEEMMKVQFHVLLSPDFNFDLKDDKVALGLRVMDTWDVDTHHMETVRKHPKSHIEMTYTLDVPKARLTGDSRLTYKYFIMQKEQTRNKKKGKKGSWEYYLVNGHDGNRTLQLPKNEKTSFWNQFDGIANRKDSYRRIAKDLFLRNSRLQNDAGVAMQIFGDRILQSVTNVDSSPAAILSTIEMTGRLMRGLQQTYLIDAKCFESEDEIKKKLGRHLFDPLFKSFKEASALQTDETEQQWRKRMTIQFTLLEIREKMKLEKDHMSFAESRQFCKAFLISESADKKTCKELEFVEKYFPSKKNLFINALVSLATDVTEQAKDPSWLYVMPLVHFLSGACSPYDEVNNDSAHDAKEPTWWGIYNTSKKPKDLFKGHRAQRWEISLRDILKTLQPLFDADFLLPRTIMACLNITELYEVISSRMIPIEVCCATLVFYLKEIRRGYSYEKEMTYYEKIICNCIKSVDEQLLQVQMETER